MLLRFQVISRDADIYSIRGPCVCLREDNWNDWFQYQTLYSLHYISEDGAHYDLGAVKIGQFGLKDGRPNIPTEFYQLDESFFSLGQYVEFYQSIREIPNSVGEIILKSLNDIVLDQDLFQRAKVEEVMRVSLLRDVSLASVQGQFLRIVQGGAALSKFHFRYILPSSYRVAGVQLEFCVNPETMPPSNIHILIGRNGVGKTYLLNKMVRSLIECNTLPYDVGVFESVDTNSSSFSGVVSISFSAFDPFIPLSESQYRDSSIKYTYVGLKSKENTLHTHVELASLFASSLSACRAFRKTSIWLRAINMLEIDNLFQEANLTSLLDISEDNTFINSARELFQKLSSGHGIVLLTVTRLIEVLEEKTLVLMDEPECHLHPPLLSALTRVLSDILTHVNGVAIVATHSPVMLQEVPSNCVWKIRRHGYDVVAERPSMETFGENVGVLTREVFGLEVTRSGFHKLIENKIEEGMSYQELLSIFGNTLGGEARSISRGLIEEQK